MLTLRHWGVAALAALTLCGCYKQGSHFEPNITFVPTPCLLESRESAFEGLSADERRSDWGKELRAAYAFVYEQDYYRAITSFKRALVFLPAEMVDRRQQMEYGIVSAYFLGGKHLSAIEAFEASSLSICNPDFPAQRELLILLYTAYGHEEQCDRQAAVLQQLTVDFPKDAHDLELGSALATADFPKVIGLAEGHLAKRDVHCFLSEYAHAAKSPVKAQIYQAILPGAGYYYVGQKKAAITSLLVNGLFIWATQRFFEKGYPAAGIITASLEAGWYFGGINGARLAADEFNQAVYELNGREFMRRHQFFPVLMFSTNF